MKKIAILTIMLLGMESQAQVAIGKSNVTNTSCLLEFGTANRGLLLSKVADATAMTVVGGTIVFDTLTGSLRYFDGTSWSPVIAGGVTGSPTAGTETTGAGVIIGATTTTATSSLLTLEATDKALVLPNVSQPQYKFSAPPRGLMVYDTSVNQVAVYNGTAWTYF